jgi:hypothetical protein
MQEQLSWIGTRASILYSRLQILVSVLVADGSELGQNPEWGPKFRRSGHCFGRFSSTWRQLNLNFLNIGFSLRCKGSKTIDKPSLNVLDLLCSGGEASKSAYVWKCVSENCRSGETSIETLWAKKLQNQVRNRNSDRSFSGICNLGCRCRTLPFYSTSSYAEQNCLDRCMRSFAVIHPEKQFK